MNGGEAVKLKIFIFWILAMAFSPITLAIPFIGTDLVYLIVIGPVVMGALYFMLVPHKADFSGLAFKGYSASDMARARSEGYHQGRNSNL